MAALIEARSEIGRTVGVSASSADLPVSPAGVRGFTGGGNRPPSLPTTFSGARGIFPEDESLGIIPTPEQIRDRFLGIWHSRLPQEVCAQGTQVVLKQVLAITATIADLLSGTGISSYGITHLKQVALMSLATGGSPSEVLPSELLNMEETIIGRKPSLRVELNLLDHFIGNPELYINQPKESLDQIHDAWYNKSLENPQW